MSTKKHHSHPHLSGEHEWGDRGQLILLFLFLGIWITDSFVFHYSTFLREIVPDYVRIALSGMVLISGWYLARNGMKLVFGTERSKPEVISTGAFRIIRHPIYTGAILFYIGATVITMSIASAVFCILIIIFYSYIARFEERILTKEFGEEYMRYKKQTGRLFPKLIRKRN